MIPGQAAPCFKTAYDSMDPASGWGSSVGGLGPVITLVMARFRPGLFKGQVLARGELKRVSAGS